MELSNCSDCVCLVTNEDGAAVCDELNIEIENIDRCPENRFNKRYYVRACVITNYVNAIDSLETDDWYEVQDYILENCQKGYSCEIIDTSTGYQNWSYADEFSDVNM